MKILTQKRRFFSDLSFTIKTKKAFSKAILLFSLFIFSSNFSNLNASTIVEILQQKPTTKTAPKTSPSTKKVDKDKLKSRLNKTKKKVVVVKDTLQDIDPANSGTPLFQNNN